MSNDHENVHTILFVDDEIKIHAAIRRIFTGCGYNLRFAENGRDGLEQLRTSRVSVIVSDLRMPELDGIQFLAAAAEISPDAVRMVLSAYSDHDNIMNSINSGHVWRYITKPWDDNELVMSVKNACDMYERNTEVKRLLDMLAEKNEELDDTNTRLTGKSKDLKKRYTKMRWKKKG